MSIERMVLALGIAIAVGTVLVTIFAIISFIAGAHHP
jgi:hypothetical protein